MLLQPADERDNQNRGNRTNQNLQEDDVFDPMSDYGNNEDDFAYAYT